MSCADRRWRTTCVNFDMWLNRGEGEQCPVGGGAGAVGGASEEEDEDVETSEEEEEGGGEELDLINVDETPKEKWDCESFLR